MPKTPLIDRLLQTVIEQSPVSYGVILGVYEGERTCQISSCLRRLQARGQVDYKAGLYYITELGREQGELTEDA